MPPLFIIVGILALMGFVGIVVGLDKESKNHAAIPIATPAPRSQRNIVFTHRICRNNQQAGIPLVVMTRHRNEEAIGGNNEIVMPPPPYAEAISIPPTAYCASNAEAPPSYLHLME
ncbi:hypothetical protein K493DRAFT_305216 [Basidiobolus meristosporus CBS 931.73]|uniref:Uncharacterized protein n=1 Tax=Basidiobolus meristosporus CBS 931.73 TaxID=1314790 RepID=A0A1Y1XWF0_9FUNG|nr:hypothetical protein K493DRAFT_305216 [Basidiobolus meristosporus CBS 931.73]|eukprot:ORX90097.1 hypothetical protein K493DRAFT_305216 [Basidiobolus meristosporus CBS 931.73]